MSHLGARLSAFLDGELSHAERERVLAHLTDCPGCRAAVKAAREVAQQLRMLDGPLPSAQLLTRLQLLSGPAGPLPPRREPPGGPRLPVPPVGFRRDAVRPGTPRTEPGPLAGRASSLLRRRPRLTAGAAGGLGLTALALAAAFAAGEPNRSGPAATPTIVDSSFEQAQITGGNPFTDPSSLLDFTVVSTGSGVSPR